MADPTRALVANQPGDFFVDATCIDCSACRFNAADVFQAQGGYSVVHKQPQDDAETQATLRALLSCPVGSIGSRQSHDLKSARTGLPHLLGDGVYYCGFNSPKSFGGNSYLIVHPEGNWMVDSPKFLPYLKKQITALGGLKYIFLTHRDDVAEAERWAESFGAERIIHRFELAAQPHAERVLDNQENWRLGSDFEVVFTPGHTRGHCVLIYQERFLFSGDHLWWRSRQGRLGASESVCWYDWEQQTQSMKKLQDYRFEWVLPGHGEKVSLPAVEMQRQLADLIHRMQA